MGDEKRRRPNRAVVFLRREGKEGGSATELPASCRAPEPMLVPEGVPGDRGQIPLGSRRNGASDQAPDTPAIHGREKGGEEDGARHTAGAEGLWVLEGE